LGKIEWSVDGGNQESVNINLD
jgi:phospholipid-translocating ATPase